MKPRALAISLAAVAAVLLAPNAARAAGDAHGLGSDSGQLILSADRLVPLFTYSRTSITTTNNGTTTTDATNGASSSILLGGEVGPGSIHTVPRVGVDFTVWKGLTVGGNLVFAFSLGGSNTTTIENNNQTTEREVDAPSRTAFGVVPRVGYILPLTEILAFWPRGGLAIYSVRSSVDSVNGQNATVTNVTRDTLFSIDLDPQLMIVPMEHFFFNVGPLINVPLTGSRTVERTEGARTDSTSNDLSVFQFGVSAGLGGWFQL